MESLSPEQAHALLVDLGMVTSDHRLTRIYGGDAEPEPGTPRTMI